MEERAEREYWWHRKESEKNHKWCPWRGERGWDEQVEEVAWEQEWFILCN